MQKAQIISSMVLSLRKKEMIKVRQPLQKIMIPVMDEQDKLDIEAVSDLIISEVNVKEVELLQDASGILIKNIKPNSGQGPFWGLPTSVTTNFALDTLPVSVLAVMILI